MVGCRTRSALRHLREMKRAGTLLGMALVLQFGGAQILPSVVECLGEAAGCTAKICCCCHRTARPAGESILSDRTVSRESCFEVLRSTCGGQASESQTAISVAKDVPHSRFAVIAGGGTWSVTVLPVQAVISGHQRSDIPPPRLRFL